jgi:hypothetical protein
MNKFLRVMVCVAMALMASFASAQQIYYYGLKGKIMKVFTDGEHRNALVVDCETGSPAQEAMMGFREIIAIDGKPVNNDWWRELRQKPEVTLTVKPMDRSEEQKDLLVKGLPVQADTVASEANYAMHDLASTRVIEVAARAFGKDPISIMSDPDVDFWAYSTFDFEFTDNNALQQREIATEIERPLRSWLTRDRENPDILIFIEFYSDRSDLYVPPVQELRTRYNTTYNPRTRQHESRQYLETETSMGYTQTTYFTKLTISMADAKKMREGTNNQSAIWQAEYGVRSGKKPDHKAFGGNIGWLMLFKYPFAPERINIANYWFTGILYDAHVAGKVAGVISGSPADKAGIKAGHIIQKCSYGKNDIFKKPFVTLEEKQLKEDFYYCDYANFDFDRICSLEMRATNGLCASNRSPFVGTYMSTKSVVDGKYVEKKVDYDKKPLVFTVKDATGQTRKIAVRPKEEFFFQPALGQYITVDKDLHSA